MRGERLGDISTIHTVSCKVRKVARVKCWWPCESPGAKIRGARLHDELGCQKTNGWLIDRGVTTWRELLIQIDGACRQGRDENQGN
jgi:hypothetical protein